MRPTAQLWRFRSGSLLAAIVVLTIITYIVAPTSANLSKISEQSPDEVRESLAHVIETRGALKAWVMLKEALLDDGALRAASVDPHSLAHTVGTALFREMGIQGLGACDNTFTGGCYHGVVEEMAIQKGAGMAAEIGRVCASLTDASGCAHGAGHGINEGAVGDLEAGLRSCESFPAALAPHCAEGVMMDNFWSLEKKGLEAQPWATCSEIAVRYHDACASSIGNYFSESRSENSEYRYAVQAVGKVCAKAPTSSMREMCLLRLAQSITRRTMGDLVSIDRECKRLSDRQQASCIQYATAFAKSAKYIPPESSAVQ